MSEGLQLFTEYLEKQGPPGPPPRPGLQWKSSTHRWIRPYLTDLGKIEEVKSDTCQELKKQIESWRSSKRVLIAMHGRYRERIEASIMIGRGAFNDIIHGSPNFVLKVGNNLQGVASFHIDDKILTMEHLASAPWNFSDSHDSRKYSGAGIRLIKRIFELAMHENVHFVRLLPFIKATSFYEKVGFSHAGVGMQINSEGMLEFLRRFEIAK